MKTKIKPRKKYALAKLNKPKKTTNSGVIIPETSQDPSVKAKIIAIGSEVHEILPGDNVILKPYAGREINIKDDKFLLIDSRYIIAKI